jgi:hypothetical protein
MISVAGIRNGVYITEQSRLWPPYSKRLSGNQNLLQISPRHILDTLWKLGGTTQYRTVKGSSAQVCDFVASIRLQILC